MIKQTFLLFGLFSLSSILVSCGENSHEYEWEWDDQKKEEVNKEIVDKGWTDTDHWGELPSYIKIYKSPQKLQGKQAIAYIAVADIDKVKFEVLGDVDYNQQANGYVGTALHTPTEFYSSAQCPVVINAGLFYGANGYFYSQNLVVKEGKMYAPNQNYYSKDWVTLWYPTLGAFYQDYDGTFHTTWTYFTNSKQNYCYPQPAMNDIEKEPLPVPSDKFPEGAKLFKAKTAIGGVTVLLHKGEIKNTYKEEMLDILADGSHPRTAIGSTANNKLILFVCEGRNKTQGVAGFTTGEVALIMKDLGCVEALNLDGGGSSCMLVNGNETIKCSDGAQRKVLTAIGLK